MMTLTENFLWNVLTQDWIDSCVNVWSENLTNSKTCNVHQGLRNVSKLIVMLEIRGVSEVSVHIGSDLYEQIADEGHIWKCHLEETDAIPGEFVMEEGHAAFWKCKCTRSWRNSQET